ncbi:adenylate kinase [Psychrobacter sp. YP14]|uniref:adenylate kinase n=1 Tax=Psychrobacter sp. YP14 TaxID=2203895 RepID=UPI000D7EA321|nr:adenylate kinase [Psychrobacter sp. YP14]AWT49114.1 adenylate kinase [Psychrobacter sp. YP14]
MKKLNVLGTSGSGKSTFAKALADKLDCSYVEMDGLFWLDNWQHVDDQTFIKNIEKALDKPAFVLDGNYSRTIPIKWKDIDTVIWLNYSFPLVLFRAFRRAIFRTISRKKLWGTNNVENLTRLFSKKSIIWWTITTHHKNRKKVRQLINKPEHQHIKFIELTKPIEAKTLLKSL